MILTDLVKIGDRFKNVDGTPADFKRGRTVRHFVGSTYQHMLDQGWYLYVAPTVLATEKLAGFVLGTTDGTYITHAVVDLTTQEIADNLVFAQSMNIITRFQLKSMLTDYGFYDTVVTAFQAETDVVVKAALKLQLEDNDRHSRNGVLALWLQQEFGRSEIQMDKHWEDAKNF